MLIYAYNRILFKKTFLFANRAITYKLFDDFRNEVGVVHAAPMIWPNTANVHTLLVIPVRQIIIIFVSRSRFGWLSHALPVSSVSAQII